jgi:phosphoribosyl 1,2-cyclic phosphodiesterase
MSLFITSLNSGSNGNCYYIGNEAEAVLIDAGISCRETEKRMARLGLPLERVRALFISHEHTDHIRGAARLAKRYHLPIYITPATFARAGLTDPALSIRWLRAGEVVGIGSLAVRAFSKLHDACDPHSFLVSYAGINVGVLTDIGRPCAQVIAHFQQCHAVFLEANYDDDLLERGRYPWVLKRRIRGDGGHLSNQQALDLFRAHRPPFLSHLVLAHVSHENNCYRLLEDTFGPHLGATELVIASRVRETAVLRIEAA